MSFSTSFDTMVKEFCHVLSEKYSLNEQEVLSVWNGGSKSFVDKSSVSSASASATSTSAPFVASASSVSDADTDITMEKIMVATKDMLVAMCKKKGLKQSGKKEELYKRLVDSLSSTSTVETKKAVSTSSSSTKKEDAPVIKSIKERTAELAIRKNKFGNYEHFESGIVFNNETKMAIGHQNTTGKVDSLTDNDIETCKKYKFKYTLPENLSVDKGLNNVKVEDVDDEDEDELDEDDIEEEEEDLEAEVDLEED